MTTIPEGMKLYRVGVEERLLKVVYVLAPNPEAAQEDAEELHLGEDPYDSDVEFDVEEKEAVPSGYPVWSGGPDGHAFAWENE